MITHDGDAFHLYTNRTSYYFRITKFGHLEQLYYGMRLAAPSPESLELKRTAQMGSAVTYDETDPLYCMDILPLEWSGIGKGDFRQSPAEIKMPDGTFVSDFVYQSHEIISGTFEKTTMPAATGEKTECMTLHIQMKDRLANLYLHLYYTVFSDADVITRRTVLENKDEKPAVIRKLMSFMLDLFPAEYTITTFHGAWIKEMHRQCAPVGDGLYVVQSTTGTSSNRQNPGFFLAEKAASEEYGKVYGFNLVYSGNHYSGIERSHQGLVRVMSGINPHCFEWTLEKDAKFETPEAIMTFSDTGFNGASGNFHDFINRHIVRGDWKDRERPVLFNTWESCFISFKRGTLLRMARRAKDLGVELFVLDDGWFAGRNSDHAGLGDYTPDKKKFPHGLSELVGRIVKMGLRFGIWIEPEMVNYDSDLFRSHPEYAVRIPGRKESLGRNQLVLDLTNPAVRDYIAGSVSALLDSAEISYVKWDMNRHMTDMFGSSLAGQGEFFHRYVIGLYDVMTRVFRDRPHVLLETCSSGGNRFDLGMLCFSPQIWASDNTDPIERLSIQGGLSYLYPLSSIGAHVSSSPHQQTIRETPLSTRFNVSCFGVLGYELDPKYLTRTEKKDIRQQIKFYKEHRRLFQYGKFSRHELAKANKLSWQVVSADQNNAVSGFFASQSHASEEPDILPVSGIAPERTYHVSTLPRRLNVKMFGLLINHILPVKINPNGFLFRLIDRFYSLTDCVEEYTAKGDQVMQGIRLNNPFIGTYHNIHTRLVSDYGSYLYLFSRISSRNPSDSKQGGQHEG